jgi:hypothetical protein
MTIAQLNQSLVYQGLTVWQTTSGYFAVRLGADQKPDLNGPFISISFCDGKLGSMIHAVLELEDGSAIAGSNAILG